MFGFFKKKGGKNQYLNRVAAILHENLSSTLGSTGVAGLGILLLLTALICMLSQISVAQGYVDTQG